MRILVATDLSRSGEFAIFAAPGRAVAERAACRADVLVTVPVRA